MTSSAAVVVDRAPPRTFAGAIAAVLVGVVLLIALCEVALRFIYPQWTEFFAGRFVEYVATPGYGVTPLGKPNFDGWFAQNNGDFRVHIKLNEQGLRDTEPAEAADGRIWFVGDSMTFGWGVEASEAFSSQVADLIGQETYNVASPGTDVCGYEALLARMPPSVKPRAVVVGLIIENDLTKYDCPRGKGPQNPALHGPDDSLLDLLGLKLFLTQHSALYNVLAVSLKRAPFVVAALEMVGLVEEPQHYHRNHGEDELRAIVQSTADEVAHLRTMVASVPFAVLIVPARFDIKDNDPFFSTLRTDMIAALRQRQIEIIDPIEGFRAAGFAPTHMVHDGHWSARGHAVAAEAIATWLEKLPPQSD